MTTEAPSGVVTFLFTDIEGSTQRWEADPEVMRAALSAHDEVLRSAIEEHAGWLFKHTGDGICAVFASPKAAVDAAIEAQRKLGLPVRMGIATGEAEFRGSDYFGPVLNRAARVMDAGHGGQILLDGQTAGLLHGVDLIDLGARRLRDIAQPVQVFQVRAPGLQTEFASLRTLDATPGNLRPATTSLIGRQAEVDELQEVLKAHRLVTLTGSGGVGKTRLAIEVAARLADQFPDGVWFFDLAAVADPEAVQDAVAAVLGIIQQPGKTVTESVAAALEGRLRLLVLDNCEHVVDAAADLVEAILTTSATVKILATSREGLGVGDEQLWRVPSLDVGSGTDSAAVTLFVERAKGVAPRFTLTAPGEAEAVIDICRRLDGIPLAIELAASRMASMTPIEVDDRLDQRFRLLVGSRRGLARHHTLRHAVAWSYDLLSDAEKDLLNRCSVFAGGFDLAGACAVGPSDNEFGTLDLLDGLVRKSLLVADQSSGRTRYSMLETIREFAEDQLVASDIATEVRTRHAGYFAEMEAEILALWDSPRQREAYDWFNLELANLRTSFRWAADKEDLDVAAAIAVYSTILGLWVEQYEPTAWAGELLDSARATGHPRLAALYVMASQCWMTGRVEDAVRYAEAGLGAADNNRGEVPCGMECLIFGAYLPIGRPERTVELCRAQPADRDTHAFTRIGLVFALAQAGSGDEARAAANRLIDVAEATHNPVLLSDALHAYAFAFRDTEPTRALDAARRGLMVAQGSGNRANETHLAALLCHLEARYGDPLAALDYFTVAIRHYHDSGNPTIRVPLATLAIYLDRLERHQPAATIAGFAVGPLTTQNFPETITVLAHLRQILGDQTYESLARKGEAMTTAAMATYAYDQIDHAREQLRAVSE